MASSCTIKKDSINQVDRMPDNCYNSNYVSNKKPLQPQQFIKLPTGSIQPQGWLYKQLELQKNGLNGHLGEISAWLQKNNNAWLKSDGEWGWEEVPYWLRGYSSLSYIFQDQDMLKETNLWIDGIINSQREDGNFGPYMTNNGKQDFWPNMIVLWILQDYYEFTSDERVIPFMSKYCHYLLTVKDEDFLSSYWENSRGGDNLWSVVWLYNRTQDPELLKLGEKLHKNTADWTQQDNLPNWHNVNIAQGEREPATYYLFNKDTAMLNASYNDHNLVRKLYGQVPGGMFGADENARKGYNDPRQGTETCGFAEQMATDEIMTMITGDPFWVENLEDIAFNSYPAALMPDYKALRYITCPNHIQSDSENHAPGIQNNGPFLSMNPFSSRCCQHNHGFAWPYYNENLVYATPDNGAAILLYCANTTNMKVAKGKDITIVEQTNYPFEENVSITVNTKSNVVFPLYLRIPEWCDSAEVSVNGEKNNYSSKQGSYLKIDRTWKDGDKVDVYLPMKISKRYWADNKNSISVDYGPLTLSLQFDEQYKQLDSRATAIGDSRWQDNADPSAWPTTEIYPNNKWNYALLDDSKIVVKRKPFDMTKNPFTIDGNPLSFKAYAKEVVGWQIDQYKLCPVLPDSTFNLSDSIQEITLIPMGASRLRISAFPNAE
ncbi:MAG: glycoside hydrolase family 127 protein [Bacteroidales bacterium]|nr:glycoside hydrolase family 127 protein [Bacteroidales bacterium]